MVIGWFISELSAGRRKVKRKEHLKRYPLDLYLGPTIPLLGLANHRLWPSDDDYGGDN